MCHAPGFVFELHEEECEEGNPAEVGGSVLGSPTKSGARVAAVGAHGAPGPGSNPRMSGGKAAVTGQENVAHPSLVARRVLSPLILVTIIYILCLFQA